MSSMDFNAPIFKKYGMTRQVFVGNSCTLFF